MKGLDSKSRFQIKSKKCNREDAEQPAPTSTSTFTIWRVSEAGGASYEGAPGICRHHIEDYWGPLVRFYREDFETCIYEPKSKLLASPLITPKRAVPYIIPGITPTSGVLTISHLRTTSKADA